jgi:hypothetical protein
MFSPLQRFVSSLKVPRNVRRKSVGLCLESLGERIVPNVDTFTDVSGGNVTQGNNWSNGAPQAGDTLVIPANITGVVTFNEPANGLPGALDTYGQLQIGTANTADSVTISIHQDENFTNGIQELGTGGAQIITWGNTLELGGGTSYLPGITIGSGATSGDLQIDVDATLQIYGGTTTVLSNNITNNGTISFGSGLICGTLAIGGNVTLSNAGTISVTTQTQGTITGNYSGSEFTSSGKIVVGNAATLNVDTYSNSTTSGSIYVYPNGAINFTADGSSSSVGLNTSNTLIYLAYAEISGTPSGTNTIGIQSSEDSWQFTGSSTVNGNWASDSDTITPIVVPANQSTAATSGLSGSGNWTWNNDIVTDYLQFPTPGGGGLGGGMGGSGGLPPACTIYCSIGSLTISGSTTFTEQAINAFDGSEYGLNCLCFDGDITGTFSNITTTGGVTYTQTSEVGFLSW